MRLPTIADAHALLPLALMAVSYAALRALYHRCARLTEDDFRRSTLWAHAVGRWRLLACLVGPALPLLPFWRRLRWTELDATSWLRGFVAFLLGGIVLFGATYAHNWFLGRAHLADRLLLAFLAGATLAHPIFAVPTIGWFLVLMHQLILPLYPEDADELNLYCHKMVFAHQLICLVAYLNAVVVCGHPPAATLLVLCLMVQGANYAASALGKVRLGWPLRNDLTGLVLAGYAHRWWRPGSAVVLPLMGLVARVNRPLLWASVIVEGSGALLALDVRLTVVSLALLGILHLAVLALSGINFLPWVALDAALAWSATRLPGALGAEAFVGSGVILVLLGWTWKPYRLAWLDARLCNAYRVEGTTRDGRTSDLAPDGFAPYDITLVNGKFRFLSDEPLLVDAWGECYDARHHALVQGVRSGADVAALEQRAGRNCYAPYFEERARRFFASYGEALRGGSVSALRGHLTRDWLAANPAWPSVAGADLARISVRIVKVLYDGRRIRTVADHEVCVIEIPAVAAGVPAGAPARISAAESPT